MPSTDELLPLLRRIDEAGWYSNFGPLVREFEAHLAQLFSLRFGGVVTVSSGTAGLVVALRAMTRGREGGYCLLPAWTFVATAQAVLEAGLIPLFCDVDPQSGALTPELAACHVAQYGGDIAVVLPVAPFGASVNGGDWDAFSDRYGVPVVVDGAASFDRVHAGRSPVVVSLHATKALGVGEGGVIVSEDTKLIEQMRAMTCFGFSGGRIACLKGGNAKMSEYHAAVGVAQLAQWPQAKEALISLHDQYRRCLASVPSISLFPDHKHRISPTVCVKIQNPEMKATEIVGGLREKGVGASIWWEDLLHKSDVFGGRVAGGSVPVSDALYSGVLALPFHLSLSEGELDQIAITLSEVVS